MSPARTARALARETITREILDSARARLGTDGAAALSLRAVARDVEMVSSAVYRYFPSRDALLTALLIEAYGELGHAAESADAGVTDRSDTAARWLATFRAVRRWCVAHPGEFGLLYGTPVPGYAAPRDTVDPATRVVRVLVRIVGDAYAAGARPPVVPAAAATTGTVAPALAFIAEHGLMAEPDLSDDELPEVVRRALMAWTALFGVLSFELFGHLVGSVTDPEAWLDQVALRLAADLGIQA
ncbi:transcriptional regulator, TetR family [Promicromonospora umidemergens]|uniref:TetR/AcrR family transcriptional regulator n=1 Tax=Promicromonospora umidemergens TaxID=629679 RepID=A0ABP8WV30_9MICO|nr:TetR/AcrR family transcriptional regulator [Promicromonospora umidemergens]MCP2283479.1 transcriptional regulator, TetR family [Promicromonospora umidemergens]